MKCDEIRERMPDLAAGFSDAASDEVKHLETCAACAEELKAMRSTMALLDEWRVPEPSPYFDTRLQARVREEMAKPQPDWLQWVRRPVLAAALTVLMGIGVGMLFTKNTYGPTTDTSLSDNFAPPEPGTAVADLQALENNHDMYSDFELLDDLDLQQDVVANP